MKAASSWRSNFAVLRDRNFRWFYIGNTVNSIGGGIASVALAFAVLHVDDSATAVGIVLAANTIPMVAFLLVGGAIADRFDRAYVLRWTRWLSGIAQAVAAVLVISGVAHIRMLAAVQAVLGAVRAVSFPAQQGLVPSLAGREHLQQANALMSMATGAVSIIGPAIAGVLVASIGGGWALAVDAVTWLVAAAMTALVTMPPREKQSKSSMLVDVREGWVLFRTTTWFWVVVVAFMMINAIQTGAQGVLAPYVAKHTIGVHNWGFALSAEAIGLLVASFFMFRIKVRWPLRLFMLGVIPNTFTFLVLGAWPHMWLLVPAAIINGAMTEIGALGWSLAMQENFDDATMSRAYSYDALGSWVAMPVGQLVYGPLGHVVGYTRLLVVSAIAYAVIALVTVSVPAVWRLGRVAPPAAEEPVGEPTPA